MHRRAPHILLFLALGTACFLLWDDVFAPLLESISGGGDRTHEADGYLDADGTQEAQARRDGPSLSGVGEARTLGADGTHANGRGKGSGAGTLAGVRGPGDVVFTGRVKNGDGAGVPDVKITLHGPGGVLVVESDANGTFAAALRPGRYKIIFDGGAAGGLLLRQYMVDGAPKEDLEFGLREPGSIDVALKRGDDPVVGAPVLLAARGLEDLVRLEGTTDQTGHALFEGLVPTRYDLELQVPEGPLIKQATAVASGRKHDVKLRVPGGVILKGKIIAGQGGPGVGGAKITLLTQAVRGSETFETEFETSADGSYEVMVPRGRPRAYTVLAEGHAPWPTSRETRKVQRSLRYLTGKKPVTRNVVLKGGGVLSGVVRDEEEKPIPGVVLRFKASRVEPISVTTKGDGTYALASLNPGRYDLQIETQAYFPVKGQDLRVSIPGGENPQGTEFDITLVGARRLEGIVLDTAAKGVAGARVFIVGGGRVVRSARGAGRLLETFSDVAGRWVIADIPPDQNVTVRAKMGLDEAKPVWASWEKPPPSPIKMTLAPTGTMTGRVTDIATRTYVRGVRVRVQPDRGDGRTMRTAYTNSKGEFSLVGLLPGGWRVTPSKKDYLKAEPDVIEVARGSDVHADLRLDPGLIYAGTVVNAGGQPLRNTRISVRGTPDGAQKAVRKNVGADRAGKFRIMGMLPGLYTITCYRKGYRTIRYKDVRDSLPELRIVLLKR